MNITPKPSDAAIARAFWAVAECSYARDGVGRSLFDGVRKRAAAIDAEQPHEPEIHSYDPTDARRTVTVRWPDGTCLAYELDRSRYTDTLPAAQPQVEQPALHDGEFGQGITPNPKARYWQERAEFWREQAVSLGYRERHAVENGEQPAQVVPAGMPMDNEGYPLAWSDADGKKPWGAEVAFLRNWADFGDLDADRAAMLRHCARRIERTARLEADGETVRSALAAAVDWAGPMAEAAVPRRPDWFDMARNALAASPAAVPEGMVLVPREPTESMLREFWHVCNGESTVAPMSLTKRQLARARKAYWRLLAATSAQEGS